MTVKLDSVDSAWSRESSPGLEICLSYTKNAVLVSNLVVLFFVFFICHWSFTPIVLSSKLFRKNVRIFT